MACFTGVCVSLVALAGVAHADDKPINLLASVPTTVAVSSTVDNAAIKPEHIADGKLDTAWNSRTGELTPHVFVRVPAGTKVTSIKLTAGFTKIDKKLGDLFTMNPRIKKIRVTSGAKSAEYDLDIKRRTLQEIDIDLPAGDIDIAVLASEPGTRKTWREISISELEVWGTTTAKIKPQRPAIRLRSLDALPMLSKAECGKSVPKPRGRVTSTEQIAVSANITLCRIDSSTGKGDSRVTLAAVSSRTKALLGTPLAIDITNGKVPVPYSDDENQVEGSVATDLVALTTKENAVEVTESDFQGGMYSSDRTETSTLYRIDDTGFVELVEWKTKSSSGMEHRDGEDCTLAAFTVGAAMPKRLKVECNEYRDDYHNEDLSQRGTHETKRTEVFTWNGTSYVPN